MTTRPGPGAKFTFTMPVPDGDIDENCHVSNIAYVRWAQEAARTHSEAVGWSKERYQSTGSFFLIRRHEFDYLRPAMENDLIKIVTWVDEWRPASATRCTTILRAGKDGKPDVELVNARTEWVFVSIEGTRPKRIPADVVDAFNAPAPVGAPAAPAE